MTESGPEEDSSDSAQRPGRRESLHCMCCSQGHWGCNHRKSRRRSQHQEPEPDYKYFKMNHDIESITYHDVLHIQLCLSSGIALIIGAVTVHIVRVQFSQRQTRQGQELSQVIVRVELSTTRIRQLYSGERRVSVPPCKTRPHSGCCRVSQSDP